MVQKSFGTGGTVSKLETIGDYLKFYTTALKDRFRLTYIDPFAGSGEIPLKHSLPLFDGLIPYEKVLEGSAIKALSNDPPFHRYVLADLKKANVRALSELAMRYPSIMGRVKVERGEANDIVLQYCADHDPENDRAVMFLDPFGNQVRWSTLEVVARTKGIDLWYLFPAGLGVARQISTDATIQKDAESSLDSMFGDRSWFDVVTKPTGQINWLDEGGAERMKISMTAEAVTRHMIKRMSTVFKGVVLDEWIALGKGDGHWYSLIFACSNSDRSAKDLARRVARDIMKRK